MRVWFLALILVGLASAVVATWIQGQSHARELAELEAKHASAENGRTAVALKDIVSFQKGLSDALKQSIEISKSNTEAANAAAARIAGIEHGIGRMHRDFAGLPARIRDATPAAATEYAIACTAVFQAVAASAGRLAKGAAAIAGNADGHALDAAVHHNSWPVKAGP